MKTALVIDWMMSPIGGAEKLNLCFCEMFRPDIFTLICDRKALQNTFFTDFAITTSFIQKLPFSKKRYRKYLPFFPLAVEQFDLSSYDLVLSSSHCVAKGALSCSEQLHICYCNTPVRYAWDLYYQYIKDAKLARGLRGKFAKFFLHYLRMWDVMSSSRVDEFIANSHHVAKRIQKTYARDAKVIYPPVDTNFFSLGKEKEDFYVTASRMVPYKKMDMIVEAFSKMQDVKLIVIGDGPERVKIEKKAKKNIEILGEQSDEELKGYLQKAKGFVFGALEDFGILPVEAQSCGTPVIAYGKGGVKETVVQNKTGIFFDEQTSEHVVEAVRRFEKTNMIMDPEEIRKHALRFDVDHFQREMKQFVQSKYEEFKSSL